MNKQRLTSTQSTPGYSSSELKHRRHRSMQSDGGCTRPALNEAFTLAATQHRQARLGLARPGPASICIVLVPQDWASNRSDGHSSWAKQAACVVGPSTVYDAAAAAAAAVSSPDWH